MNYKKHYENLIERSKSRNLDCYVERHHIIPKCLGGSDDLENIVELTAREHFIAHLLLYKIYPKNFSLLRATLMMTVSSESHCDNRSGNRRYSYLRERYSRMQSDLFKNGGSPTQDKRWISNENETVLVSIDVAKHKISLGTHILGKTAKKDKCGHLVRPEKRCLECKPWLNERNEKSLQIAESLYKEFIESNCESIAQFAKTKNTSQPRLTMLWSRYVEDYNNKKCQGKSFKKNS